MDVWSTGVRSKMTVHAAKVVNVSSTGWESSLTVHADDDVEVRSTGNESKVVGTYVGSKSVDQSNIGEDAAVDLKHLGIASSKITFPSPTSKKKQKYLMQSKQK